MNVIICSTEDGFQSLQNKFMEDNYLHFEDTEENKFIYTAVFKEYVSTKFATANSIF